MLVEIFIIWSLVIAGSTSLRVFGLRGWPLLPLGFIAGVVLFVLMGYLQALLSIPATVVFPLGVVVAIPLLIFSYQWRRGKAEAIPMLPAVWCLLGVAVLVVMFGELNLTKHHFDSFRYLVSGSLIFGGHIESLSNNLLTKRFSSVPILHSLGNFTGSYYLFSITPLVSLSTLASFYWLMREGVARHIPRSRLLWFSALGIALLVSIHNYVWHSFYLNGHMLMATFLMLTVGIGWVMIRQSYQTHIHALVALQILAIVGLVLTRPEAPLIASVALFPILLSSRIRIRYRALFLATLGFTVLLQQGFMALRLLDMGRSIPNSVEGFSMLGIVALMLIPFLIFKYRAEYMLWAAEIGLWLVLAMFALDSPDQLASMVLSTFENVVLGKGHWGVSLVVLGVIFIGLLIFRKFPYQTFIRFPLTTFIPLSFIVAYLVGGAYRTGVTDSFNRMLMHIVPLAVLFVILAAASGYARYRLRHDEAKKQEATSA